MPFYQEHFSVYRNICKSPQTVYHTTFAFLKDRYRYPSTYNSGFNIAFVTGFFSNKECMSIVIFLYII